MLLKTELQPVDDVSPEPRWSDFPWWIQRDVQSLFHTSLGDISYRFRDIKSDKSVEKGCCQSRRRSVCAWHWVQHGFSWILQTSQGRQHQRKPPPDSQTKPPQCYPAKIFESTAALGNFMKFPASSSTMEVPLEAAEGHGLGEGLGPVLV